MHAVPEHVVLGALAGDDVGVLVGAVLGADVVQLHQAGVVRVQDLMIYLVGLQ